MRFFCGVVCVSLCVWALGAPAAVWYVDEGNTGSEDGTSWATAFTEVQDAIDAAYGDGGGEVWVAAGVYDEARVYEHTEPAGNTGSLKMQEGVALYGGFTGSEASRVERNPAANQTWIDGSTARDGAQAYHVIVGAVNTVLDGFMVTGGCATGQSRHMWGSGIYANIEEPGNTAIAQCTFIANGISNTDPSQYGGGAAYLRVDSSAGNIFVTDCAFIDNRSYAGGGIKCRSNVEVTGCVFSGNYGSLRGGAVDCIGNGAVFRRCTFSDNEAGSRGGAIHAAGDGMLDVENCEFLGNVAGSLGGAINTYEQVQYINNCTFWGNEAPCRGAAVHAEFNFNPREGSPASLNIVNTILWDPSESQLALVRFGLSEADAFIQSSNVHCAAFPHSGSGNIDADPHFVDAANGNLLLTADSPCIDTGTSEDAPTTDILGCARPQGSGVDMGAYEYAGCFLIEASQPAPFIEGQELTFTVVATGTLGATAYVWYKDGFPLTGQNGSTLHFASLTETHEGSYWCEVSGGSRGIFSTQHVLVEVNPEITVPASSALGLAMAAVGSALAALRALRTRRCQG